MDCTSPTPIYIRSRCGCTTAANLNIVEHAAAHPSAPWLCYDSSVTQREFSIVYYLQGEEEQRIRRLQLELAEVTGSRKCLTSWTPHLTLGSGIIVPEDRQIALETTLSRIAEVQKPLLVNLLDFGGTSQWPGAREGITSPFVLWTNVETTADLLALFDRIRDEVTSRYETFYPRIVDYIPHVTLAYGDLTASGFSAGRQFLHAHSLRGSATISHVALVEHHPTLDTEYRRFIFGAR